MMVEVVSPLDVDTNYLAKIPYGWVWYINLIHESIIEVVCEMGWAKV